MDLKYLHQYLDSSTSPKFAKLNKAICGLIEDFSLVSFVPLNIQVWFLLRSSNLVDILLQDKDSVYKLVRIIDKANGYLNCELSTVTSKYTLTQMRYVYGGLSKGNEGLMDVAQSETSVFDYDEYNFAKDAFPADDE